MRYIESRRAGKKDVKSEVAWEKESNDEKAEEGRRKWRNAEEYRSGKKYEFNREAKK